MSDISDNPNLTLAGFSQFLSRLTADLNQWRSSSCLRGQTRKSLIASRASRDKVFQSLSSSSHDAISYALDILLYLFCIKHFLRALIYLVNIDRPRLSTASYYSIKLKNHIRMICFTNLFHKQRSYFLGHLVLKSAWKPLWNDKWSVYQPSRRYRRANRWL